MSSEKHLALEDNRSKNRLFGGEFSLWSSFGFQLSQLYETHQLLLQDYSEDKRLLTLPSVLTFGDNDTLTWWKLNTSVMADDTESKHGGNRNGKKEGLSGSSFFTWFMVIALLGVWTSVAVVWFELVDYEEVLAKAKDFRYNLSEVLQGKLGIYDADGDGDFDVEDAKVLLGLTKDGSNENIDSLEEVLNILAEESSDWFYGFLSFLYDVLTPFEILEEEESEAADDVDGTSQNEGVQGKKTCVILDLQNQ